MTGRQRTKLRHFAALWTGGSIALALVTAVCLWFHVDSGTTAFFYLIVIVLLSLLNSVVSSLLFSVIAFLCLDFFFTPPIFSLDIDDISDFRRLCTFALASIVITSLVRRLRHSRETHERQARQLDLTHDAIVASDASNRISYWNRGAEELYGWKREEALGKEPQILLRTEFAQPFDEISAVLTRTGRWEGELGHTRHDGTKICVASRWSLQRDDDGEPIGRITTDTDITQRKRAEEQLRHSEAAFLAEAQKLSRTGSFRWNLATGELFWSDETFRIFALDPTTQPSVDVVLQRVHPDDLARVRQVIEEATNDRRAFDLEHRLVMPDGGIKTVHVRAHALDGKPDTPVAPQFVGAVMDVTARSEAYAALLRTEARFRYLFDNMPVALVQLRTRGRVRRGQIAARLRSQGVTDFATYLDQHPDYLQDALEGLTIESMNERAVRMFGVRDAGELTSVSNEWIWKERPETFRRILESRFRGEPTYQEETKIRTLDGRMIDVLFTIARPEQEDSDTGVILYGFIDVTESVRTQEKLQMLQAEFAHAARLSVLGELAASIAHELNQPLAALAVNGQAGLRWLNRSEPNVVEASMAMRRLVAEATRASDIIARIRSMAARQAPRQVAVSLHDVIEEAMLFLRHELQSKQVAVSLDLAPDLPPVLADRIQLQQVVVNLAINAVQAMTHAMTKNRVLAVETVRFDDNRLICTLEDSGPGIAQEHLNRLFETFFTTKELGMGLGLAISRTIIEGHGGDLWADNEFGLWRCALQLHPARGGGPITGACAERGTQDELARRSGRAPLRHSAIFAGVISCSRRRA